MNWKNHITLLFGLQVALFTGCDSVTEDVQPRGENELEIKSSISAMPETDLFIDLKQQIRTANVVRFEIDIPPSRGVAELSSDAVLHYLPHKEFTNGFDFLSLNLFDGAGILIDSDSIKITMTTSVDSLPCFNGALSDYYTLMSGQSLVFEPILNDGYCVEETSGAVINFTSQPLNGTLEKVELFTYRYTPDVDFVGTEKIMYELELIDDSGDSEFSLAKVEIKVLDTDSVYYPCDSIAPYLYTFLEPRQNVYSLPAVPDCITGLQNINIISVDEGSASYDSVGLITFYPGTPGLDDRIAYEIQFDGGSIYNEIIIRFEIDDTGTCQAITQAENDFYELNIYSDSVGMEDIPHILNVTMNDVICGFETISLLTQPDVGVAQVLDGTSAGDMFRPPSTIQYTVSEEFLGTKNTSFLYEVCSQNGCDTAQVDLKINRY